MLLLTTPTAKKVVFWLEVTLSFQKKHGRPNLKIF